VRALAGDQDKISHRLHTLETWELIRIGHAASGKTENRVPHRKVRNGLKNSYEVVIKEENHYKQ
jgi:hypothetical protein